MIAVAYMYIQASYAAERVRKILLKRRFFIDCLNALV